MAEHKCECFEVVGFGLINFTSKTKKVIKGAGGTTEQAVQEAVDDAIESAMNTGKEMLKKQTCAGPCKRFRFVLPQIWSTQLHFGKGSKFTVEVTGQWTAYIVCYDPATHTGEDGSSGKDPGHDSGKPGDGDAPKKPPGKPKAPRKPKG